jgi:hypothetical protein
MPRVYYVHAICLYGRADERKELGCIRKRFRRSKATGEGEDLSLLEFKAIEYKRKGNAVATDKQLARIANVPKREFMRRGINQHTLEKICRKGVVRSPRLAKVVKVLQQWESEQ